jgi:hypothetical protein
MKKIRSSEPKASAYDGETRLMAKTDLLSAAAEAATKALESAEGGEGSIGNRLPIRDGQTGLVADIKARCLTFGLYPNNEELIAAGLLLLTQLTETALEAALLQSLRADRSVRPREFQRENKGKP